MANADENAGWYAWITQGSIIPPEYAYVFRLISAFFTTLALIPIAPIICLVIYDICLWVWRLCAAGFNAWIESRRRPTRKHRVDAATDEPEPKRLKSGNGSNGSGGKNGTT
ncbi:hypothetical protein B0T18DRAFT_414832 [Schizothecium vesticola]|uniref:Uncharacterized protein n=1 Tax=Schizothecium vesticola TaxID=314040 RepID=A0AA40EPS1_9PEZI|nr:hypothetical protein B0T18DRAFT_414832 [Schizothecium vesticola]